jgi:Txe/YoeB family toxin of Txe-Axe toxin-antitoxin module
MIKGIVEVPASEKYLKIFFFQLLLDTLSSSGIEFEEENVHSLIKSKSFEEMTSTELFDLCKIHRRWGLEDFTNYLTEKFFYVQMEVGFENQEVFDHPTLYTKIQPIIDGSIYEAQIGLNCHLLNQHGRKLFLSYENEGLQSRGMKVYAITPNLFDNGFYDFKVYSNELIELLTYDDNNGADSDLYQLKDETYLLKINELIDKQSILSIIQQNKNAEIIKFASDELLNDFELLSICIGLDSALLEFASKELQNNVELVYRAVSKDGNSIEFASDELKDNKKIVITAVQENPFAIAFASEKLRNDKEIALLAIEKNPGIYIHLGKEIKNDPEIKNKIPSTPTKNVRDNWNMFQLNDDELNAALEDPDLPF